MDGDCVCHPLHHTTSIWAVRTFIRISYHLGRTAGLRIPRTSTVIANIADTGVSSHHISPFEPVISHAIEYHTRQVLQISYFDKTHTNSPFCCASHWLVHAGSLDCHSMTTLPCHDQGGFEVIILIFDNPDSRPCRKCVEAADPSLISLSSLNRVSCVFWQREVQSSTLSPLNCVSGNRGDCRKRTRKPKSLAVAGTTFSKFEAFLSDRRKMPQNFNLLTL